MGHDAAGENLAALYSLIATCEVNGVNPVGLSRSAANPNKNKDDDEPALRVNEGPTSKTAETGWLRRSWRGAEKFRPPPRM